MSNIKRATALRKTLLLGTVAGVAAVYAPSISAQDQSADISLEEIVVTGSHIRRDGYEARAPINVINRSDFTDQGASTVVDIVKYLPVNTGSFLTQETGSLIGTSQFNIRGLGTGSSLTLINGRRAGKSATADGLGNQFFDVNQLPLSMIERIDVQTDGAGVTYGSEAVGGVVNIVTRKGFEGFEISGKMASSSHDQWNVSIATGAKSDKGSINLYATYYRQTRNDRSDFQWLRERIGPERPDGNSALTSSSGAPGTWQRALFDDNGVFLGTSGNTIPDPDCEEAGGILSGGRCRHSFEDQVSVIPEETRIQAFAEAEYNLTDELRVFTEISFSNNEVDRTNGPNLFRNGLAGGNMYIPADHPFNFYVSDGADGIMYIDPTQWDNSIHQAVDLTCQCRPLGDEFNGDRSEFDREFRYNYYRALGGVNYEINDSWYIEADFIYNKAERSNRAAYGYVASELNKSLLNGTFNPFGTRTTNPTLVSPKDGVSVAALDYDDFAKWHHRSLTTAVAEQSVADLIVSGDAFEMSGGMVGIAFGGQFRDETFIQHNDPLSSVGLGSTPDTSPLVIQGSTKVYAVFAEALLPVTADLEVTVAARHEKFSGGVKTTDPKIGARWQMTDDIALRASYGTSFQLPSARQKSSSSSTQFLDDPAILGANGNMTCDGGNASNTTINVTGSDDLQPQTAKNVNAGIVVQKAGFSGSIDYWRFDYTNLIGPDGVAQAIVSGECNGGVFQADPRVIRSPSGQVRSVNLSNGNFGGVVTDGLDIQAGYTFPDSDYGQFGLRGSLSYVNKFDVDREGNGDIWAGAGTRNFANPFNSVPRWRGNVRLNWNLDVHSANAAIRYISSYENDQGTDSPKIGSWASMDLRYSYAMPELFNAETARISIGVNNVFDKKPPALADRQRPGYDATVHDIRGRMVYAEFSIGF
ncbi:hypothetical protein GCM10017044_09820 [Kordiimonas sediminis]|uniref:TonB-dependent receptor n=1 Tax=Kordiimonas sediminis TaxID=1735581 RepID=A0A919ANR8_9PROT|nr:TonB-dependent receptor [Kordiimonas sediminis]GHF17479.1 hypothetical protein GCM10017044_09820 [Kordiimonas sediminis]